MQGNDQIPEGTTPSDKRKTRQSRADGHATPDEARIYEAQSKANAAAASLEREKRKNRASAEKIRRRKARGKVLSELLTPKRIAGISIAIVALIVFSALSIPGMLRSGEGMTYLSASELEKVVSISKLSTAEYVYNGIAEIKDEEGNVTQRIYYSSTVRAGIDLADVTFTVDNDAMTVTPIIPEITIYDPSVDESSFDYIPRNPNLELRDIITICKADAHTEIESQGDIYRTAKANLESAVQALTLPLLEDAGYELIWPDDASIAEESVENSDSQPAEGVSDEA